MLSRGNGERGTGNRKEQKYMHTYLTYLSFYLFSSLDGKNLFLKALPPYKLDT